MATSDELQEQLALTTKINRIVEQMATSVSKIESSYENQVTQLEKINVALNQINVEATVQEIGKLTASLKDVVDELGNIGATSEQNLQKVMKDANQAGVEVNTLNKRLTENVGRLKAVGTESSAISELTEQFRSTQASVTAVNESLDGVTRSIDGLSSSGTVAQQTLRSFGAEGASIDDITDRFRGAQVSLNDVNASLANVTKNLGGVSSSGVPAQQSLRNLGAESSSIGDINDILKDTRLSTDGVNQGFGGLINTISKKLPKAAIMGAGAVSGLYQGFQNIVGLTKGVGGFFTTILGGLAQTAISIAAIPLKIFTGLVDLAASASGGMSELLQEVENVRKAFGDLKGPTASAIRDVHKELSGFSDTGLSAYRIFGTLGERLAFIRENAEAMGAVFGMTADEWKANGGALLGFQKGLGITAEQMKFVGQRAIIDGKSMSEFLLDSTKQTLALGKAFGISQKVIGKDMAAAFQDMKHFAQISVKEIAQASVYARKLGLELDKIVGTLDAFETFDSAAENAAKLTQTFGVQIDAFKLMEAQSPAEQVDMLRKSFKDAGVDAASFSRQQLKLLESTTGLDAATAKQVFSLNNQGASLDEIKEKSEVAEKKQLSQAEAMSKLADSIERMIKSGQQQSGSFFDMFVKGIGRGLQASEDFRGTIWNIKRALQQVFMVGVQLGRILPNIVPGLGQIMKGLRKFFDPKTFKTLAKGASDAISSFFKGNKSLPEALNDLRQRFMEFFAVQGPIAMDIYDGFKKMFKFAAGIVKQSIPLIAEKIKEGIQLIVDFIRDPKKAMEAAAGAGASEFGFFAGAIMEVAETLKDAAVDIWPHLKELLEILWEKVVKFLKSDEVKSMVMKALPFVAGFMFGPAFARTVTASLTASLADSAIKAFKNAFSRKAVTDAAAAGIAGVAKAAGKTPDVGKATSSAAQAGQISGAAAPAMKGQAASSWGVKDAAKLGLKLVALAGALAVGGIMVAYAVVKMKSVLEGGGIKDAKDAAAPLLVMGAMVTAALPMALALKLVSKVGSMKDVALGGLILSASVGIVGGVGALLAYVMGKVGSPSTLKAAAMLMGTMTLVFLGMVPLILAATAIGALATGPQAVVLVATAAGMGVIAAAVGAVAATSAGIVKEIDQMKLSAGFQTKLDAFLGVMQSMQAFTGTFLNVVKATTPSLTELITGTAESMSDKLDAVTKLVKEMVGKKGGGGLIGLVTTVLDVIKEINVDEGLAKSAEVFSNVLSATASMLQAMTPPDAWFEAGTDFIQQLSTGKPFADLAVDAAFYMRQMREGLITLLKGEKGGRGGLLSIIEDFATMSIPEPEKASQIAQILGSMATMLKNMAPDPKMMEAFSTGVTQSAAWGLLETKVKKLDFAGIRNVMKVTAEGFGQHIIPAVKDMLTGVLDKIGGIDPKKMESFKVIGPVLSAVATILDAMTKAIKTKKETFTKDDEKKISTLVKEETPGLRQVFDSMKTELPGLIKSLIATVSVVPTGEEFSKHVDSASKLFGFLTTITQIASKLATGGTEGKEINNDMLVKSVASMAMFLHRIAAGKGAFGTSKAPLVELVDNLSLPVFARLGTSASQAIKTSEGMNKLVSGLSDVAIGTQKLMKNTEKIEKEGLGTMVETVRSMVEKANELESILANESLNKVDVPTRLKALAKGVGLGSSGRYTIANKDVKITINLSVSMDAAELEKVLLLRKTSIIRDRLNFATSQSETSPDRLPDNPNAPFQKPIQPGPT